MKPNTELVLETAANICNLYQTTNGKRIAAELGIEVLYRKFKRQKGAYTVLLGNRFIFLRDNLTPVMENIVLLHEIGHDQMHREEAQRSGGFQEFSVFDMQDIQMEYEANLFAAQVALPDDEMLGYMKQGFNIYEIAKAMYSDINLVIMKFDILYQQGIIFQRETYRNDFLKYD